MRNLKNNIFLSSFEFNCDESLIATFVGTEIDKVFKGKDHSSSRKERSKERKLERSEEGSIKESEIGCNMTQNQQLSPIFTKESTLHQTSFHTGEGGREEGTHQPQS